MDDPDGIPCLLMRGGTSKGAFFLAEDLPTDDTERDDLLLRIMGSPDPRQIDGVGGATPLTSKVAIVAPSTADGVDLDYLFAQLGVDDAVVGTTQTCGNLLAAVGPFGVERGLVRPGPQTTTVRIRLLNTGDVATAHLRTPGGVVQYSGDAVIDGVPGTAAPIELQVTGGSRLLPTGNVTDEVAGRTVTLVDNGMPVVLMRASDFGISGEESPEELEADAGLGAAVEEVRRQAGPLMGLAGAAGQSVPKMFLLSPPRRGGTISTRAFIPTRVHSSIGVLMAASVAAGVRLPGSVAADLARSVDADPCLIEHPAGSYPARVTVERDVDGTWRASSFSTRTARKLFDGRVFPRPRPTGPARATSER